MVRILARKTEGKQSEGQENALKAKGEYRALGGSVSVTPDTCGDYPKH